MEQRSDIMINEFLSNLEKSLRSETVPQAYIDNILNTYKNIINQALAENKRETDIVSELGNPVLLARDLRQKFDIKPKTMSQDEIQKIQEGEKPTRVKRSAGILFLSLIGKILINIIAIPVSIIGLLIVLGLFTAPFALGAVGLSGILYQVVYINGYELILSTLTSIALGIGLIGLAILLLIGLIYVLVWYIKMITLMFSNLASIIRRYE